MKTQVAGIGLVVLALIYSGCGDDVCCPSGDGVYGHTVVAYAQHWYTCDNRGVEDTCVEVHGSVTGSPLPGILSIEVNGVSFSDPPRIRYHPGEVRFGLSSGMIVAPLTSDTVDVSVETPEGRTRGMITIPDSLRGVVLAPGWDVPAGGSLTIEWEAGDADIFDIFLECLFQAPNENYWGFVDTLVSTPSVTIGSWFFRYDGHVHDLVIRPIKGPFPESGATPNMTSEDGSGQGFLYFRGASWRAPKACGSGLLAGKVPSNDVAHDPPAGRDHLASRIVSYLTR